MATTYNKQASSFKSLKDRLSAEFSRRNQNGSLSSMTTSLPTDVGGGIQ